MKIDANRQADFTNQVHISTHTPYAVSKAALSTLMAKINASYENQGIMAISICPGFVDTTQPGYKRKHSLQRSRLQAVVLIHRCSFRGRPSPSPEN